MESVTVNPGSVPTEEQALAALEEAAATAPSTTEEALAAQEASRAPQLPEKFKSTEDLLKAYQELEKKLGVTSDEDEPSEEEASESEEDAGDDLPEEISEDDVEEAPEGEDDEEGGSDDDEPLTASEVVEYLTGRFSEQEGQLSAEDYQLAEDMGYDRNMVDAYIRGQQAAQELADLKINEAAGGRDNLEAMLIWAATGLEAKDIDAYNASLADNDIGKATLAVAQLREQYERANGREPARLLGGKPGRTDVTTFASWADVTAAMSDKRYGKDAAYTAQVTAKVGRSSL